MLTLSATFDAAPKRARRRVVLRPIGPTVAFVQALTVLSREAVRRIDRQARPDIIAAATRQKSWMTDADVPLGSGRPGSLIAQALGRMRDTAERVLSALMATFERLFGDEGGRFDRRFTASFSAAVADGVDLARVLKLGKLDERMMAATERHAALIKGLTAELEKRIAARLMDLMIAGAANQAIADVLAEEFGFGLKRARFIARDQAAKWNGELNRLRQTDAGVTEYVWSTSLDERVRGRPGGKYPNARPSHWAREGKTFRWNDPPEGGGPGFAINCRCVALAVLNF